MAPSTHTWPRPTAIFVECTYTRVSEHRQSRWQPKPTISTSRCCHLVTLRQGNLNSSCTRSLSSSCTRSLSGGCACGAPTSHCTEQRLLCAHREHMYRGTCMYGHKIELQCSRSISRMWSTTGTQQSRFLNSIATNASSGEDPPTAAYSIGSWSPDTDNTLVVRHMLSR